ncbi:hypothetical protein GQ472_03495 [archaeon]|nr:hypothetical protein [archaeon]
MHNTKYRYIIDSENIYAVIQIKHSEHDIDSIHIAAQEISDVSYVMIDMDKNNDFSVTLKPKGDNDAEAIIKRFCDALELRTKDARHSKNRFLKDDIFLEWDRQPGAIRKEPGDLL